MKKVYELMKDAARQSVLYLRSLKDDQNISFKSRQQLMNQLDLVDEIMNIESSGITAKWIYLIKLRQVNSISYALGQLSAIIGSELPASQIEKTKNIMIATSVMHNYLSLETQKEF